MALKIVHYNDPRLRKAGAKVTAFDRSLRLLAEEMVGMMHELNGIGLAAQQVGEALQLCVVDLRETESDFDWLIDGAKPPLELIMPLALVNPVVTPAPGEETSYDEGCLSFPGIRGPVVRPDEISVRFHDAEGHPHELHCNGLFARCIQHEVDHLQGVLFIDRMGKEALAAIDPQLRELRKRTKAAAKAP